MKLVTMHTDYAARALLALSRDRGVFLSARTISEREGIPYQFLRRILGELISHDLVESREGSRGGFRLKVDPGRIRIVDLIRIFQGELSIVECLVRGKPCSNRDSCVLRHEIRRIEGIVSDELGKITIGSIMNERRTGGRRRGRSDPSRRRSES